MSQLKKTVDRILSDPSEMQYSTVHALLRRFGYHVILTDNGTHFSYWNDDVEMKIPLIVVVHHNKVYEFDKIIEQLDLRGWNEDNGH